MRYFEEKTCQKACGILLQAVSESMEMMDRNKYKRAQLILQCALEDVDELLSGNIIKQDGRQ